MWSAFGVETSACTFPHGRVGLDPRKDHHRIARQPCVFPAHREETSRLTGHRSGNSFIISVRLRSSLHWQHSPVGSVYIWGATD